MSAKPTKKPVAKSSTGKKSTTARTKHIAKQKPVTATDAAEVNRRASLPLKTLAAKHGFSVPDKLAPVQLATDEAVRFILNDVVMALATRTDVQEEPQEDLGLPPSKRVSDLHGDGALVSTGFVLGIGAASESGLPVDSRFTLQPSQSKEPRSWLIRVCNHAPEALRDAMVELVSAPEIVDMNMLSAIGNLVSEKLRRRILLDVLTEHRWNMTATAQATGMANAGTVTRAIRDLKLEQELEAARASGLGLRGKHRSTA